MMGSHNDSPTNISLTSLDAGSNSSSIQNIANVVGNGASSSTEVQPATNVRRSFRHFRRQQQPIAFLTPAVTGNRIATSSACNGVGTFNPVCKGAAFDRLLSRDDVGPETVTSPPELDVASDFTVSIIITDSEGVISVPFWDELGLQLLDNDNTAGKECTPEADSGTWTNQAFELSRQMFSGSDDQFEKRLEKLSKVSPPGIGSRTRLLLQTNKAKKTVSSANSYIHRYNCVGAVGYAVVLSDERIPENDFFRSDIRFRIRLRHSAVRCDDDAAVCQREAAIKFADQNEDGPLDLILLTGRTALARNANTLMRITNPVQKANEIKEACHRDPFLYFALVDGLRRSPDSYADQVYHSQIAYLFVPSDGCPRLAKFRLVPGHPCKQTGLLTETDEQLKPWDTARKRDEKRSRSYLRHEFMQRMETLDAVRYILQVQLSTEVNESMWNPQLIWNEEEHPWIDLVAIQLTTVVPLTALCKTYFNIVDKPSCLRFGQPSSVSDPLSYHYVLSAMLTRYEIEHLGRSAWSTDEALQRAIARRGKITHYVTLCTATVRDTKPRVDVYVTLIGTRGRTAPHRLDHHLEDDDDDIDLDFASSSNSQQQQTSHRSNSSQSDDNTEHYVITSEPVGEILALSISVRHRHLTDEWYLRYVILSDPERTRVRHFPCQNVVLSKATLRSGEVSLPQKDCHELLRQERLLELRDRQSDYLWSAGSSNNTSANAICMPDHIGAQGVRELPVSEQIEAGKYGGMQWEIDPTTIETLLPALAAAAARGLLPNIPLFHRQTSNTPVGDNLPSIGPLRRLAQQRAARAGTPSTRRPGNTAALRRWRKIRFAIAFISKAKLPDGPKGDMCRSVQDDVDFGRFFLMGPNPTWLERCSRIPDNFAVTDADVEGYLSWGKTLADVAQDGKLYIADYATLADIPTIRRDADTRYVTAPLVLFVVRDPGGDLIPIAIQLGQDPGPDNPIWTPRDNPEDWIMAKLWVRCADFHVHYAITHLLKTHLVIEPFAVAMMRQLSTSHPIYKLMKPHFRYTMSTNTLIRRNILRRGFAVDKYTSIGADGFRLLISRYVRHRFTFDELDLPSDLAARGVDDVDLLPGYFYRDDGLRLWDATAKYCSDMLKLFYSCDDDVTSDTELQSWIQEIHDIGFASFPAESLSGLPTALTTLNQLSNLTTRLIFTSTCQHSATHTEALDLYGFVPGVPAMMRQPPMNRRRTVTKDTIARTLPDQFPDAYYGSLATVLQIHRPEEHTLGDIGVIYFVEPKARQVTETFEHELRRITRAIRSRNTATSILYENLIPSWIPNSVEPLPFLPKAAKEQAMSGTPTSDPSSSSHIFIMTPSVPLMILPMCMYLARTMGGARGGPAKGMRAMRSGKGAGGAAAAAAMDGDVSSSSRGAGKSQRVADSSKQKFTSMF